MHSNYNPSMNSGSPYSNPGAQQAPVYPGGRTKNTGYAAQIPGSMSQPGPAMTAPGSTAPNEQYIMMNQNRQRNSSYKLKATNRNPLPK